MYNPDIVLQGARNARDLGGIKTKDGREIRNGMLFRSSHLHDITTDDVEHLESIGLKRIIDLRSPIEKSQKPDIVPATATYIHCPVIEELTEGITREAIEDIAITFKRSAEEAKKVGGNGKNIMRAVYPVLAESPLAIERFAKFLDLVLTSRGPVLFHCSMGKDRAGVATGLVLFALGVPMETIVTDYMYTGIRCEEIINGMVDECRAFTDDPVLLESIYWLDTVDESYIMAYFEAAERMFGSMEEYLEKKLNFGREKQERLKKKYLL